MSVCPSPNAVPAGGAEIPGPKEALPEPAETKPAKEKPKD